MRLGSARLRHQSTTCGYETSEMSASILSECRNRYTRTAQSSASRIANRAIRQTPAFIQQDLWAILRKGICR